MTKGLFLTRKTCHEREEGFYHPLTQSTNIILAESVLGALDTKMNKTWFLPSKSSNGGGKTKADD